MKPKRDGLSPEAWAKIENGSEHTIAPEDIAAALGLQGSEPKQVAAPLTPNQAARKERNEYVGEGPPDYEHSVIDDPEQVWNYLGRPSLEAPTPPGYRDGDPLPVAPSFQPRDPAKGVDWEKIDAAKSGPDPADEMRSQFRRIARADVAQAVAAVRSGNEARTAAAVERVRGTVSLGQRLKRKLGQL